MASMREMLRKRFDWMPPDARERAIDEVFNTMRTPSPAMVEEGATHIREAVGPVGLQADKGDARKVAELVFSAMCLRASEGG